MKKILKISTLILVSLAMIAGAIIFMKFPYLIQEKSPFDTISWKDGKLFVVIENKEYEWLKAENEDLETIKTFAKKHYKDRWRSRITDDYILTMSEFGHWVFFSTKVSLKDKNNKIIEKKIPLSAQTRTNLINNHLKNNKITRTHTTEIPENLKYLTQRIDGYSPSAKMNMTASLLANNPEATLALPMDSWISKELAEQDLESLEYYIKNNFSYADLRNVDYKQLIDVLIADLQNGISKRDLGTQIKRVLALFGDGHSRVSRSKLDIDSYFLPFSIKKINGKFIALSKEKLFNKDFPELVSIDGFDIQFLQNKAEKLATKGTEQLYESQSLQYLSYYGFLQKLLNKKDINTAEIVFRNQQGNTEKRTITLLEKSAFKKTIPHKQAEKKILKHKEKNIAYIFIPKMEKTDSFQDWLKNTMKEFKNTDGLIIDIRGNGGGNRKPIYTLLPYFLTETKIININTLRINKADNPNVNEALGGLEERMAYPENSTHWTQKEKEAIAKFKKTFNPEITIDSEKFSQLHYSLVHPNKENHYNKPVIILMNKENFSASDIFLGAFKGVKNIILLGEKSGGGSGYMRVYFTPNSGIMYLLSRMMSFQPNGKLYDGNGISPDIYFSETLEDIKNGKDSVLEKALEILGG